jgi:hypothetical protein
MTPDQAREHNRRAILLFAATVLLAASSGFLIAGTTGLASGIALASVYVIAAQLIP